MELDYSNIEVLPIVDANGKVIGAAPRSECHNFGGGEAPRPLHPVVHLHLLNSSGALYLQKRSMTKKLLPGYWDTAVGGHVSYSETLAQALERESREEIGLTGLKPIYICSYLWESAVERELVNVFALCGNYTPLPNMDEVSEGRFFTFEEIDDAISSQNSSAGGRVKLTPNFIQEFGQIKDQLRMLSSSRSWSE